ncbi:MAG: hypothetical protein FJ279_18180 [Planctomycetes bacterium]|nr:hypothetical protein [Planctomycetota bacterium]MBM4080382.1 hypothetical protein [Planctomycetota bacterium]
MRTASAVEAPTFWTQHFPSSFYPRAASPASLTIEETVPPGVARALEARGHNVTLARPWSGGNTLAASIDPSTGVRRAAASPRLEPAYAAGH